jgi:hypothetical protein
MGSTSTLAAEVRALIFSACGCDQADVMLAIFKAHSDLLLVIGQDEGGVYSCWVSPCSLKGSCEAHRWKRVRTFLRTEISFAIRARSPTTDLDGFKNLTSVNDDQEPGAAKKFAANLSSAGRSDRAEIGSRLRLYVHTCQHVLELPNCPSHGIKLREDFEERSTLDKDRLVERTQKIPVVDVEHLGRRSELAPCGLERPLVIFRRTTFLVLLRPPCQQRKLEDSRRTPRHSRILPALTMPVKTA